LADADSFRLARKRRRELSQSYAVRDYYGINPVTEPKMNLKRLISEAHKRRIKVIIDIVANHTSWDSVMMKWPEFYRHDASGKITYPHDWFDVAQLNYDNPKLRDYMTQMLKYWIREFDLDGFRCDVAGDVPTDFWEKARSELDMIKPDIFMLAEAHKADLEVKAFEVDYSWPLTQRAHRRIAGTRPCFRFAQCLGRRSQRVAARSAAHASQTITTSGGPSRVSVNQLRSPLLLLFSLWMECRCSITEWK